MNKNNGIIKTEKAVAQIFVSYSTTALESKFAGLKKKIEFVAEAPGNVIGYEMANGIINELTAWETLIFKELKRREREGE